MGHTLLCVLGLFLLNTLLYGHAEESEAILEVPHFTMFEGDSVTLRCRHRTPGNEMKASFIKDGSPLKMETNHPSLSLVEMTINPVSVSDGGTYKCKFDDGAESEERELKVEVRNRVDVILQPNWPQIFRGETITLSCEIQDVGDTEWEYEWRTPSSETPPQHKEYRISRATESHSGDYSCKGRRDYLLTQWSDVITLTVSADRPKPTLTADKTIIPVRGAVTLSCSVEGSADWKYYWFSRTSRSSGAQRLRDGGADKAIRVSQGGLYHCRGGRGDPETFTRDSDTVTIQKTVSNRAVVTLQPNWLQIFSGEKFTVRCEIQGGGDTKWTYEWTPAKLNRPPTDNEYRISRATVSHSGDYSCKGRRDSYSSTEWSDVITLTVSSQRPKAELSADRRDFPAGGSVTLSCSVNLSSGWKYFWYRGEKTSEPLNTQDAVFISDGQISVSQGGLYWCRGGRGDPVYYTEDSDAVGIDKIIPNRAVVTLQPNWSEIYSGETITLRCEIKNGGDTEWEYEWKTTSSYKPLKDSEYRIKYAYLSHSGDYSCKGRRDSYSSTELSDVITLTVSSQRPKAELSADRRDFPAGGSVTLSCSVNLSSGWKYFWYRGEKTSEPLNTQDAVFISDGQISVSQGGLYWCRGGRGDPVYYTEHSNAVSINKIIPNRAVVTLQPNWSEIYSGETITLRCEIKDGGDTEWEYEWETTSSYKPLKDSEYRIRSAYSSHSGDYSCKGRMKSAQQTSTDWSDPVKLTVSYNRPQPVLTVSPSWLSPGASVTLSCRVKDPSAGWRFFWFKAVPKLSGNYYDQELLPGSSNGTEQDSYIVHGQTHTAGYKCRAGRGDPVYYTSYSEPKFVWSADFHSSASLTVSPDRVQHFTSDSVSLSCEGNSTEWRVRRFTKDRYLSYSSYCSYWGTMTGSTCSINSNQQSDAVYWCESGSGEFSNAVNITKQMSRPESSSVPVPLIVGLVCGIVLILLLLLLYRYRPSKDSCSIRPIQSESTNRGSAENYSSPVHVAAGDAPLYETIKGFENTQSVADESQDFTYSLIELKNIGKKKKRHEPEEVCVYSEVNAGTAGKSPPAAANETVYSEVKPGTALGL
ncbi:Fc receptor-like protein 5 isoform X4 [Micropterus salmoides]|uniref:Fc receptor-like protein 5 isoform X4 n=1 Tax=Micropterus salmoides TaxID=27706 RepID=UPI0018ED5A48|nr:Fc receptor-like protein 5 isoform X4 [Micropterus salmoides]